MVPEEGASPFPVEGGDWSGASIPLHNFVQLFLLRMVHFVFFFLKHEFTRPTAIRLKTAIK